MAETAPLEFIIQDEQQLTHFSEIISPFIKTPSIIYLNGNLGTGKTTFTQKLLYTFNYHGKVKSPTYTIVEEYTLKQAILYHFDLYRISDPEELEFIGIRDYVYKQSICIFEWASKGKGIIPKANLIINFEYLPEGRKLILNVDGHQYNNEFIVELHQLWKRFLQHSV